MQVHVVKVSWQSHASELQAIRTQVFVVEQEVSPDDEWDAEDPVADHFLAISEAGIALGCARLVASGQIGRMAVLKEHRGLGLGVRLLQAAVTEAKTKKMDRVFLHAQSYAQEFYRKGGFIVCGPEFSEVGIPHFPMEMMLPLSFDAPVVASSPRIREAATPAKTSADFAPTEFDTLDAARENLLKTIQASTREIYILSPYLDHDLFDHQSIADALSNFVRDTTRARVRILIMSSKVIVARGHRLLELARRLDEKIQIRWHDAEVTESTSTFVCGDQSKYWLMPVFDLYDGMFNSDDAVLTARFRQTFVSAWDRSKSDPEIRTLRL